MVTKQHCFGSSIIVPVLLGVLVDVSSGMMSIEVIPPYPVIGRSVTLSVTGITGRIVVITWYKGPTTGREYQILTYVLGDNPIIPGPLFIRDRMTALPNGSLQISNLNISDEGDYTVRIQADKRSDTNVHLKIYDMVGKPTITTSSSLPKEKDSVTLTCTSTNAERILWSRVPSGAPLPSGATLSQDNRTVSFSRIHRSDSGDYRCQASNPVSTENSDPVTMTVAYGPENVKVKSTSLSNSIILLECSADSVPPATYHWRLNGTDIKQQQSQLQVAQEKAENEGTYTCVARNSVTQLTAMYSVYVNVTFASTLCQTSGSGLGGGEIAGIVIGTVFGIFLLEVIVYFVLKAKRKAPSSLVYENEHVSEQNYERTLPGTQEKVSQASHYEELTFKDKSIYSIMKPAAGKY